MKPALLALFGSLVATAAPIVTTQQQCTYLDGGTCGTGLNATASYTLTDDTFHIFADAEARASIIGGAQLSMSRVIVTDLFYGAGPVRPGFLVITGYLDNDFDNGGSAGGSLTIGPYSPNTCRPMFGCNTFATIPYTFGDIFAFNLDISSFASSYRGFPSGAGSVGNVTIQLYENFNGTPGTLARLIELPEPGTWLLSFAGIGLIAWLRADSSRLAFGSWRRGSGPRQPARSVEPRRIVRTGWASSS